MSGLYVGGYWSARRESIEQCANRLSTCLTELAACDPVFATWYERGMSRKEALESPVKPQDLSCLRSLLERGRKRRDTDRSVIEELGFGVGMWNGGEESKDASLRVSCGLYRVSSNPDAYLGNSVVLDLPDDLGELQQAGRMSGVLAAVARAWEPDWAGVIARDARNARAFNVQVPFVDWMVYVPRKIGSVPPPSTVTRLENGGSMIVVQPNRTAVESSTDQERIRRIDDVVRQ